MERINLHTRSGSPTIIGEVTVQPVSQSVSWIGRHSGFVWNRPFAIKVEHGGNIYQLPIRDYTQIVQAVLWGLTALFVVITIRRSTSKRRT